MKKAIIPVAFDLTREECDDGVAIGPGTKIACDIAHDLAARDPKNSIIFSTAGYAGKRWDRVWVGKLMADYIYSRSRSALIKLGRAARFSTFSEMECFADILSKRNDIDEITIAVNSSYAGSAKTFCDGWLKNYGLTHIPVSMSVHIQPFGPLTLIRELLALCPHAIAKAFLVV